MTPENFWFIINCVVPPYRVSYLPHKQIDAEPHEPYSNADNVIANFIVVSEEKNAVENSCLKKNVSQEWRLGSSFKSTYLAIALYRGNPRQLHSLLSPCC
jgi:hypothetical protein